MSVLLLACVVLTLLRSELGLERIFLNASVLANMVARIRQGYEPGSDAQMESVYQAASRRATAWKNVEWWLSKVALFFFVAGLLVVAGLALVKCRPGGC